MMFSILNSNATSDKNKFLQALLKGDYNYALAIYRENPFFLKSADLWELKVEHVVLLTEPDLSDCFKNMTKNLAEHEKIMIFAQVIRNKELSIPELKRAIAVIANLWPEEAQVGFKIVANYMAQQYWVYHQVLRMLGVRGTEAIVENYTRTARMIAIFLTLPLALQMAQYLILQRDVALLQEAIHKALLGSSLQYHELLLQAKIYATPRKKELAIKALKNLDNQLDCFEVYLTDRLDLFICGLRDKLPRIRNSLREAAHQLMKITEPPCLWPATVVVVKGRGLLDDGSLMAVRMRAVLYPPITATLAWAELRKPSGDMPWMSSSCSEDSVIAL